MSMIWMIGIQDEWMDEFADTLNGFFAVKRIVSFKNFTRLLKMHHLDDLDSIAFVMRISTADEVMSFHSAVSALLNITSSTKICVIGDISEHHQAIIELYGLSVFDRDMELVSICKNLRNIINSKNAVKNLTPTSDIFHIGDIEVDRMAATMKIMNTETVESLTPKEVKILQVLSAAPDYLVSREDLIKRVWTGAHVSASTIDSHMSRLRKKVECSFECAIETQYGTGWTLTMRSNSK